MPTNFPGSIDDLSAMVPSSGAAVTAKLGVPIAGGRHDDHHRNLGDAIEAVETSLLPMLQTFNVKAYGAVGNNVALDTAAIQATIDAASAAGGGIVYVPPGTYKVTYTGTPLTTLGMPAVTPAITMRSNVHLVGTPGSIIQAVNPGVGPIVAVIATATGNRQSNFKIRDLTIDGGYAGSTEQFQPAIYLGPDNNFVIEGCELRNCSGKGIMLVSQLGGAPNLIANNFWIRNNFIHDNASNAIGLDRGATDFEVSGNHIKDCRAPGTGVEAIISTGLPPVRGLYERNIIQNYGPIYIGDNGPSHIVVRDNIIIGPVSPLNPGINLGVGALKHILCEGNIVDMSAGVSGTTGGRPLVIEPDVAGATDIIIRGNILIAAPTPATAVLLVAGAAGSATGIVIADNTLSGGTGGPPGSGTEVLRIAGSGVANVQVHGNTFINNTGQLISLNAEAIANGRIFDNPGLNPVMGTNPNTAATITPAVPATTVAYANGTGFDVDIYITAHAAATCTVSIAGVALGVIAVGALGTYFLPAGQSITLTYTSAPTWKWMGR